MLQRGLAYVGQQAAIAMTLSLNSAKTDLQIIEEYEAEERQKLADEKLNDPENYKSNFFLYNYMKFSQFAKLVCHGEYEQIFNNLMIVAILLAGVLVGIQTYPSLDNNPIVSALEYTVLASFLLEAILKIAAEGLKPQMYFVGKDGHWNSFDFIVIILCLPFMTDLFEGKSPIIRMVTRLSRLVRASKIVRQIPALNVIIMGLVGGLKSIMYIAILLILVFYFYAVIGVILFRFNDPFNFRSIPIAMLCLFRACTLDGWGDTFKINAYGCKFYNGGIYISEDEVDSATWSKVPQYYRCDKPMSQPIVASTFWVSFIVISALVMLALFIGCITMSMQASLDTMKQEVEEANRRHRLLKQKQEIDALLSKSSAIKIAKSFAVQLAKDHDIIETFLGFDVSKLVACSLYIKNGIIKLFSKDNTIDVSIKEAKRLKEIEEMRTLLLNAWGKSSRAGKSVYGNLLNDTSGPMKKLTRECAYLASKVLESHYWANFLTGIVIFTALLIGIETDNPPDTQNREDTYNALEWFIFAIFLTDLLLHMMVEEFMMREFFKQAWNTIDFIIVICSILPGGGSIVNIVRLLRLLRVLKLVKAFPELSVIVNALIMGIQSIGYIGCIITLTYYLFAILAMILFQKNDPFRFGSLHLAFFTLFDVATLDNWSDVMFTQFYGCANFPSPISRDEITDKYCTDSDPQGMYAIIFFIFFVVVGAMVMLTLFVGVVTTSMEEASSNQGVEKLLEDRIKATQQDESISTEQLDCYRRVFALLDLDGGGTIDKDELRTGLNCIGMKPTEQELEKWVKDVDQNEDGVVDLIEFCVFMTKMQKIVAEKTEKEVEALRILNAEKRAKQILVRFKQKMVNKVHQKRKRKAVPVDGGVMQVLNRSESKLQISPTTEDFEGSDGDEEDVDIVNPEDDSRPELITRVKPTSNAIINDHSVNVNSEIVDIYDDGIAGAEDSSKDDTQSDRIINANSSNGNNDNDNSNPDNSNPAVSPPLDVVAMKEMQSLLAHPYVLGIDRSLRRRKKYFVKEDAASEQEELYENARNLQQMATLDVLDDPSTMNSSGNLSVSGSNGRAFTDSRLNSPYLAPIGTYKKAYNIGITNKGLSRPNTAGNNAQLDDTSVAHSHCSDGQGNAETSQARSNVNPRSLFKRAVMPNT